MLHDLLEIAIVVFAVSSMLAVGLTYTLREIVGPLADIRLVALALVANFVLVPAWALVITWGLDLEERYAVGLVLVATAAGAAFLVKLAVLSDGDVAFAASLLVLLMPATVLYMPVVVPLIVTDADVDTFAIATPLVLANLLPLAVGLGVLTIAPAAAKKIRPILGPVSSTALLAVAALTVAAHGSDVVEVVEQRVIIGSLALIIGAFLIGFFLGVPDHHRDEMGLATAQRNIAAATVVATQALDDPDTLVTVVLTTAVSMAVLFPLTTQLKKHFGLAAMEQKRERRTATDSSRR